MSNVKQLLNLGSCKGEMGVWLHLLLKSRD